jgi:hypothetical protein
MSDVNDNFLNQNLDDFYEEEVADVITEDAQTQFVLSEAVKRIEQAKLYETLLKHQLFGPGSARPEIIAVVEKEVKAFILSRLEILLGLKREGIAITPTQQSLPFSKEQIEALEALANKLISRTEGERPAPAAPVLNPVAYANSVAPTVRTVGTNQVAQAAQQVQPAPKRRRARSNNVSQMAVQRADGSMVNVEQDYSQAVNPKAPPLKMPSQAHMDQMNAQQAAKAQQGTFGGNTDLGKLLGAAIALSQQKNANIKEE